MIHIIIYGTSACRYCTKAKEFVESLNIPYEYVDISKDEKARRFIVDDLGQKKIPQCFINNRHVGGYTELVEALKKRTVG